MSFLSTVYVSTNLTGGFTFSLERPIYLRKRAGEAVVSVLSASHVTWPSEMSKSQHQACGLKSATSESHQDCRAQLDQRRPTTSSTTLKVSPGGRNSIALRASLESPSLKGIACINPEAMGPKSRRLIQSQPVPTIQWLFLIMRLQLRNNSHSQIKS